ncbi:MAG: FlgB family protein [Paracoccaceae bacterium]
MFQSLDVLRTAQAMAVHAGRRHAVIAQNVANADTPGYRAHDVMPFAETLAGAAGFAPRVTRPGHVRADGEAASTIRPRAERHEDPNGNSVSLELEILRAVESKRQHDRALSIYGSALKILRASIGRG